LKNYSDSPFRRRAVRAQHFFLKLFPVRVRSLLLVDRFYIMRPALVKFVAVPSGVSFGFVFFFDYAFPGRYDPELPFL